MYGDFINAVIAFVILAAILYFFVVIPFGKLLDRYKPAPDDPAPVRDCPQLPVVRPAGGLGLRVLHARPAGLQRLISRLSRTDLRLVPGVGALCPGLRRLGSLRTSPAGPVSAATGAGVLDESDVTAVLNAALASGADWAEVYAEKRDSTSIRIEDRRVEELTSTRSQGVGRPRGQGRPVRLRVHQRAHPRLDAGGGQGCGRRRQRCAVADRVDLTRVEPPVTHPARLLPAEAAKQAKVDLARRAEQAAWAQSGEVVQVLVSYADVAQRVFVANSFGHLSDTTRVRTRLVAQVVASRGDLVQTGFDGPGAAQGMEFYDEFPPEGIGERAAQQALRLLDSVPVARR